MWFLFAVLSSVFAALTSIPAAIRTQPTPILKLTASLRKTAARITVITMLSLSIGATFDAGPFLRA